MVSEEVNNNNNKTGFFAALRAIFSSDEENLNEEDRKEIEALNAESAKSIEALEKKILSDRNRKKSEKKLADELKVAKTTLSKGENKETENRKEKGYDLEK